ncbi:hypothetical protein R75461_08350 [Paraburkholderia nemoris]|uniref:4'-phosphopantetheinyl transferase family protein n=1 Tax=Paraburkholderia nemoris TaxID=2793076 RepID=UPI00190D8304|nr:MULTISPECIES: 4'-phosphopantetheinyl transferase superfamily protein [Paraburkholderia]MBK3787125.1 4'-phosphopantetheinyl transferase superfamily protein [Paraburkholderia aspalathi]CAE6867181.1 hypothetical protein R75461_08350 [Paraburkholderia nemoris]
MTGQPRAGQIHVFVVWQSSRLRAGALLPGLSRAEQKMSRTFISGQARVEFIVSRFCLRLLASRYLGVSQREIELRKTATGQPRLVNPRRSRDHRLNISLSHCARGIAIALARKARVGVDLETHQQQSATIAAVARLLTGRERTLTEPSQIWDCWARKEALLKGLGLGLSGLGSVPPLEHQTNAASTGIAVWTVASLSVTPDCSLACAAEGMRRFRLFTFRSCKTINRSF